MRSFHALVIALVLQASAVDAQESLCNPCFDPPMRGQRNLELLPDPSPGPDALSSEDIMERLFDRARLTVDFVESDYTFTAVERRLIERIAEAAVVEARSALRPLNQRIRLTVSTGGEVLPQTGSTAQVLSRGHIGWQVDPAHADGITTIAQMHLRPMLIHELLHVARDEAEQGLLTVMDVVVSEGLAVAFERDFNGQVSSLGLGDYPADVDAWVSELQALPESLDEAFADGAGEQWMFRHPDGRQWIAYRAGTYIVDEAMKASGLSAAELVATPTNEILRLAGVQ